MCRQANKVGLEEAVESGVMVFSMKEDSSTRALLYSLETLSGLGGLSPSGLTAPEEEALRQQKQQQLAQRIEAVKKKRAQQQQQKKKKNKVKGQPRKRVPDILEDFPTRRLDVFRSRWLPWLDREEDVQELTGLSLRAVAIRILNESNPQRKAAFTMTAARMFRDGLIPLDGDTSEPVPDEPGRDVETVDVRSVPKRGGGGTLESRIKMCHAQAHIESIAVDLMWDMIARFGFGSSDVDFPREFYEDFADAADDEARHFLMWSSRLEDMGSHYGAIPTHSGLWDSARETADKPEHRLVIEHMVLEARGLDVATNTYSRFNDRDDPESADCLEAIYSEEVSHVGKGIRWFRFIVNGDDEACNEAFKDIVSRKFHGYLKPPFNDEARQLAGMPQEWYAIN